MNAFEDLGFARVDHDRAERCGFAEVVFAQGKTAEQTVSIVRAIRARQPVALATRVPAQTMRALREAFPEPLGTALETPRLFVAGAIPPPFDPEKIVLVAAAGTSDLPVAEEALWTIRAMGVRADLICDVGVAGLHRLLAEVPNLRRAKALVAVAGMEGALASVLTGLVSAPVIAVPTSVGYGASMGGIAALLAMLNSCATGMAVVNIDNGFGAGALAARIVRAQ